ncbi:hypothetical protein ABAC402_03980 [Asticcacaulis sp. AC402]|nr:hypothetical protein ABAC402_03980 [Asticcacaulis sp. AC402]
MARKDDGRDFAVCGYINGRNSLRAYTGLRRFVVTGKFIDSKPHFIAAHLDDGNMRVTKNNPQDPENALRRATHFEWKIWNPNCESPSHPAAYNGQQPHD